MQTDCWKDWKQLISADAMKEMQTNWIGKSEGAEIEFEIEKLSTAKTTKFHYNPS